MSNRLTVPRNLQVPAWRKDHELRLRAQERARGGTGSSFATPFHVGDTTFNTDAQGELIQMDVFAGDVMRARRGNPIARSLVAPLTVTSFTTLVDLISVDFQTKRDNALVDLTALTQFHTLAPLSDDNLYLVVNFQLDNVDITLAPYWVFSAGVTGFFPKALTFSPHSTHVVPAVGNHTAKIRVRKANIGPPADNITFDKGESVLWVSIYEVIG